MVLLLVLTTLLFLFISFVTNITLGKIINPLYLYYFTETTFIFKYMFIFAVGFIAAVFIFIRSQKFDKHYSIFKNYLFSLLQIVATVIIGFFISFALLFCIAVLQLNIFASLLNLNPQLLGIQTDTTSIISEIKSNNAAPEIIASDNDQNKELQAIAAATTGKTSYYGNYILDSIPNYLIVPIKKSDSSLLLLDNTLIVTAINPRDMQLISPTIGYLLLKNYFWRRAIKSYPTLSLMNRTEYEAYRLADTKNKLKKIDLDIKKIEGYISSISAVIQTDKKKTPDVTNKLQSEEDQLKAYQYYDTFFKTQIKAVQSMEKSLPNELGFFEPKEHIKIALDTTSSHAVADYLETVVHEYLHYASYVSQTQRFTDSFFEEGLTEYFARNIIQSELQTTTNLGYPLQVKIINEMTKLIPESELVDIYFTKDENRLEDTLDRVYGDNFYQDNQILFETLQYTSDHRQALKLANTIMSKIGGAPLQEKDLFSNSSKL